MSSTYNLRLPPLEAAYQTVQDKLNDIKKCNRSTIKFNKNILNEQVTSVAIQQLQRTNAFLELQLAKHQKSHKELSKPKNISHGPSSKLFVNALKLRNALRDYSEYIKQLNDLKGVVEGRLSELQEPVSPTQESVPESADQKTTEHKEAASQGDGNSGPSQPKPAS